MDGQHFDRLARSLARGAILAGVIGDPGADAARCHAAGASCLTDAHCCSGGCDPNRLRCVASAPDPGGCVSAAQCPSAVGDRLLVLAGVAVLALVGGGDDEAPDVRVEAVALAGLRAHAADPATPLYNQRVDGDHTYVADDWLMHNKFF